MTDDELCWDNNNGRTMIGCQKPRNHYGERHGYGPISGMSAAWGYLDYPEEED